MVVSDYVEACLASATVIITGLTFAVSSVIVTRLAFAASTVIVAGFAFAAVGALPPLSSRACDDGHGHHRARVRRE